MEETRTKQEWSPVKKRGWLYIMPAVVILGIAIGSSSEAAYRVCDAAYRESNVVPNGYYDYTVQKQQYYVEYSDEYPYWDVLTVEYPVLASDPEEEIKRLEEINEKLYDTAMDRVNYWHLTPNEEVKALQEEYHIFSSDVQCDVMYHSQYLLSVNYRELYAPINPVGYVLLTQRALMIDLLTGKSYALGDVLRLDEDFVALWVDKFNEEQEEERIASEDVDIFVDWFNGSDEVLEEYYSIVPFFCVTEEGNFVIGLSFDPKVAGLSFDEPSDCTYYTELTAQDLAPYRTASVFWDRYDKSESTGEVFPCEEKHDNLWLGEDASVWGYWEERQ